MRKIIKKRESKFYEKNRTVNNDTNDLIELSTDLNAQLESNIAPNRDARGWEDPQWLDFH